MGTKEYTIEFKKEAIKLAKEVGAKQAMMELNLPRGTIYGWLSKEKTGEIDLGVGSRTPSNALSLAEEIKVLREKNKEYEKEIARINKINTFLEEASRFFAASRQK
jgi:transposase